MKKILFPLLQSNKGGNVLSAISICNNLNKVNTGILSHLINIKLKNIDNTSTHYKVLMKKKSLVKRFFIEDLGDNILVASASGKFQFSENYDFNLFNNLKTNLDKFNVKEIIDIQKINNDIFIYIL